MEEDSAAASTIAAFEGMVLLFDATYDTVKMFDTELLVA